MGGVVDVGGWLLAALGLAAAVVVRGRLMRYMDGVARACHELRGPITAARLGLELGLRVRQLPPSRLRAIELELGRATLALEDLGAAGRRPRLGHAAVDLAELAADSVAAWQPVALGSGTAVRLEAPAEPVVVVGDRLRLAQALGNLIANAIEHGGGGVEVTLQRDLTAARLMVLDRGPGLPASVERLCARRRPGAWPRTARRRGHGLSIVDEVARAHGGRLLAAPSDRGARLVLELPTAPPSTWST